MDRSSRPGLELRDRPDTAQSGQPTGRAVRLKAEPEPQGPSVPIPSTAKAHSYTKPGPDSTRASNRTVDASTLSWPSSIPSSLAGSASDSHHMGETFPESSAAEPLAA